MTILLPVDHGVFGGAHGMHAPLLHIPKTAMTEAGAQALRRLRPAVVKDDRYLAFDFKGWRVHLPLTTPRQQPVDHAVDEIFDATEPVDSTACALVGSDPDRWKPLSRLPILNHLTKSPLRTGVHTNEARVQGIVELSGGRLECVYSKKALRDAFFEFFTDDDTVLIQPAAEDVEYTTTTDGTVTLGVSPQHAHSDITPVPLLVDPLPFVIISLPPDDIKPTNLNHFANFYRLMVTSDDNDKGPFVRMIARCDRNSHLVHTMPGIKNVLKSRAHDRIRTVETCSCLASQVFAGPFDS